MSEYKSVCEEVDDEGGSFEDGLGELIEEATAEGYEVGYRDGLNDLWQYIQYLELPEDTERLVASRIEVLKNLK
jgi:hypothetical protein